tara:strand:+ start:2991 stop:4034 length:1044 start_codon:yes stop_codon:yes gene_type:complete
MKKEYSFLGNDVTHWTQSIRRGYSISFLLYSFHESGVFDSLKSLKAISASQIAKKNKLNLLALEHGLNFLVESDNSIKKMGNKYKMTTIGRKRIFSDQARAMSLGAVGAYHILLTNYLDTLRNKKRYGKDFLRDGELVAKSSVLTGRANYSWVANKLKVLNVDTVVDLGCGSGDIIIDFCKRQKTFKGVGLDISKSALRVAKINVKKNNLTSRIDLIHGDMKNPETYSSKLKSSNNKLAFNAIMALHEFLIDGEQAVIKILKKMKKKFPGSYLILGEFNKASHSEFQKIPIYERMHMLFYQEIIHGLTDQGLTSFEGWKRIFKKSDVKLIDYKKDFPFRLVEYVIKF